MELKTAEEIKDYVVELIERFNALSVGQLDLVAYDAHEIADEVKTKGDRLEAIANALYSASGQAIDAFFEFDNVLMALYEMLEAEDEELETDNLNSNQESMW